MENTTVTKGNTMIDQQRRNRKPRHSENDHCVCDCGPEDGCYFNGYHYRTCPEYVLWHGPIQPVPARVLVTRSRQYGR